MHSGTANTSLEPSSYSAIKRMWFFKSPCGLTVIVSSNETPLSTQKHPGTHREQWIKDRERQQKMWEHAR